MKINQIIDSLKEKTIMYRRHLHQFPELSKQEYKTQDYIISVLKEHDIAYDKCETGVIAYINKETPSPCIGLRADIDALPISEINNVSYKSKNKGVMHACGHDAHTAILLSTIITLKRVEKDLEGSIKCFFQHDEEVSSGAINIIENGFMENPKVTTMLGLHVMPYLEVGEIEVKNHTLTGSSTYVSIDVYGKSCHAAYPEQGVDAIIIASDIILKLQTIVSRNISPLDQNALSLSMIKGGIKPNIVCDHVQITGTLRTVSLDSKERIMERINTICNHTALAYNGTSEVRFKEGYSPLVNDPSINEHITKNAGALSLIVKHKVYPSLGVEDFGYYLNKSSGAYYHLGCGNKSKGIDSPLHSSNFDIDEDCLKIGVSLQVSNVLSLLNQLSLLEENYE